MSSAKNRVVTKGPVSLFKAYLIDSFLWGYSLLVFYKVIYQKIILMERYPEFNWGQPLKSLAIGAALSLILFYGKNLSVGKYFVGIDDKSESRPFLKTVVGYLILFHLFLTILASFLISQISFSEFFSSEGLEGAHRIFSALFHPKWEILEEGIFAAVETAYMAFIATIIAIPFAFVVSFFASRNIMANSKIGMVIYSTIRITLNVTRSIEPLVWAIIFSVWVGIGPFSGMLALCLHSFASLIKLYSEQIESVDEGPIEAMMSTGAHPVQVIWFGVVPQVILPFLSFTIYRWDINVRMATIIGLVGGGGIGTMIMQYQGLAKWNEVGMLVILIAIIVWAMDSFSSKIREAIK
ncbi:MAG: phosphonate ABC transporter, permease protein PhnE [Bacteriovoracaceae bacterium]